jgi:methylglutaconyl-CoA hydratase
LLADRDALSEGIEQMNEATPSNAVIWRVDERGVAYITLNRPQVYNAYNGDLIAALLIAFDKLAGEPLRAAVIIGAGRNFQAGADVKWLDAVRRASPQDNLRASRMTAEAIQRLNTLPIPTVALVQGACFGGGTGIIAACDIVIAADNAIFSIAEVRIGVAGTIIIPQLNDAIGVRQVRRYALTAERFDVKEAHRIGLVHEIVPLADLQAAGERIVDHLLANGPEAIAQTKTCALRLAWGNLEDDAFAGLIESHAAKRQSEEAAEGFASFLEKRPARWNLAQKPTV